jgi:hypothetical protein
VFAQHAREHAVSAREHLRAFLDRRLGRHGL